MSSEFSICVLISGGGTTLQNLLSLSREGRFSPKIARVISSHPDAKGLEFARQANIPSETFSFRELSADELSERVFESCRESKVDLVVLGGFLRKLVIPDDFENRVVNIHPSLIPSFCGKGYYGIRVHRGVLDYGVKLSGCTVHFVDNQFDHGPILAQETVPVMTSDTPETLAKRVFAKECEIYPRVIEWIAEGRVQITGRKVEIKHELNSQG